MVRLVTTWTQRKSDSYPTMHCNSKYIIDIFVTSSLCPLARSSINSMASFVAVDGECATVFESSPLLYLYCVSNEDFPVCPIGLTCVSLVCRQVHVSFVHKMSERRISLVAFNNGRIQMEDMRRNVRSPVLISLRTSCDLKVSQEYSYEISVEVFSNLDFWLSVLLCY